ncbi:MAG: uroporphyrinogen decarboxylase family protein [Desulfobacterales bacterium]
MSYDDGWSAINLEMPERVPRTEYSAESHWPLIQTVTGIDVDADSPFEVKQKAQRAFIGADGWNYDFFWMVLITAFEFGDIRTRMGHAEYAANGSDFNDNTHQLFTDPERVLAFDPYDILGGKDHGQLVKNFESHYRYQCRTNPDCVNMTGVYITCLSGLIDLFGWNMLLMAAGIDAERFGAVTHRYGKWMQQYFDALADADVPVVMVHDDIVWSSGAYINPEWYRRFVFPNYKKFFSPLIESGKKIIFTSDGDYALFADDIADCGVHGFVMEPWTDMAAIAEKYGKTHVLIGNADTRVLLSGTKADIQAEVRRCMDIGKQCPGFFMAVGNHIPVNTPVENALYYNEVYTAMSRR